MRGNLYFLLNSDGGLLIIIEYNFFNFFKNHGNVFNTFKISKINLVKYYSYWILKKKNATFLKRIIKINYIRDLLNPISFPKNKKTEKGKKLKTKIN